MVMTAAAENSDQPEIERFVDAMWIEKGLSDNTLNAYRHDLRQFNAFLGADRGRTIMQASRADLQRYLGSRLGDGGSQRSAARLMSCLRGFYRYQLRETRLTVDPTLDVDSPKLGRPLPRSLSESDVEKLLAAPDTSDVLGLRDRAMLELLYACGLRVSELTSLQMSQVSPNQGVIR